MDQGRLPGLQPKELTPDQRHVYDLIVEGPRGANRPAGNSLVDEDGCLYGPFNAMLYNPHLGEAIQTAGAAMRFGTTLPGRVREIAVLEVAAAAKSNYEWNGHVRIGRQEGLTDDEITAIENGAPITSFSADELVAREAIASLIAHSDLSDEMLSRVVAAYGYVAVVELVYIVGYYQMIARALRVWRVPLREGSAQPFPLGGL